MIDPDTKKKFIEELEKCPVVIAACQKCGISKASVYRWADEDAEFDEQMQNALQRGRISVNDYARSALVSCIKDKNLSAIRYWLSHNDDWFRPKKPELEDSKPRGLFDLLVRSLKASIAKNGDKTIES